MTGPGINRNTRPIRPGQYRVEFMLDLPENAYVHSMRYETRDVLNEGMEAVKGPGVLDLLVRTDGGRVTGKVTDDSGNIVHDASVVLVPEGKLNSQAIFRKMGRTDQRGMFELGGVAPGTYRLYALADPEQLRQPDDRGALIDIKPASTTALDLRFNPR